MLIALTPGVNTALPTIPSNSQASAPPPPSAAPPAAATLEAAFTPTFQIALQTAAEGSKAAPAADVSDAHGSKKTGAKEDVPAPQPDALTSLAALILPAPPPLSPLPEICTSAPGASSAQTGAASLPAVPAAGVPLSSPGQQSAAAPQQIFSIIDPFVAAPAGQDRSLPSAAAGSALPGQQASAPTPADAAQTQSSQAPEPSGEPQAAASRVLDSLLPPPDLPTGKPTPPLPAPVKAASAVGAVAAGPVHASPAQPANQAPPAAMPHPPAAAGKISVAPQATAPQLKTPAPAQPAKLQTSTASSPASALPQTGPATTGAIAASGQTAPIPQVFSQLASAPAAGALLTSSTPATPAAEAGSALPGASNARLSTATPLQPISGALQTASAPAQALSAPELADLGKAAVSGAGNSGAQQHGEQPATAGLPEAAMPGSTPASAALFSVPPSNVDGIGSAAAKSPILPAVPTPEPPLLPLQSVHLLQSVNGSELRLGLHSTEFGSVSIATTASSGALQASIALDHGGLGHAIAAHLPALEEKLGLQARVEVRDAGANASGQGGSQSSPQGGRRYFPGQSAAAQLPLNSEPASAAGSPLPTSATRLSVLA